MTPDNLNNSFKQQKTIESNNKIEQHIFIQRLLAMFSSIDNIKETLAEEIDYAKVEQLYREIERLLTIQTAEGFDYPLVKMKRLFEQQIPQFLNGLNSDLHNLIDLIDKLFDYIIEEKHLAKDMSDTISQLRIIFFKIALTDKNLFIQESHPCRVFFNELIKLSLLWCPKEPKTFAVKKQLTEIINQIIAEKPQQKPEKTFKLAIEKLTQFSIDFHKKIEIFEKRTLESEEGKAKIELAKLAAKNELDEIMLKESIPDFVIIFLTEVWQHVLFLEKIRPTENQQGEALSIAKQLLVSLNQISSFEALLKFSEFQPLMVEQLEIGLQKTSYSLTESTAFLEQLNNYHKFIISEAISLIENEKSKDSVIRLRPVVDFNNQPIEYKLDKNDPLSIREMKLEQWLNQVFNEIPEKKQNLLLDEEMSVAQSSPPPLKEHDLFKVFQPGKWFEFKENDQFLRAKFTSYIKQNDKFLFVNGGGNKVTEYVSNTLNKAFNDKEIFIFDDTAIFDRAYNQVAKDAKEKYLKIQASKLNEQQIKVDKIKKEQEESLEREKQAYQEKLKKEKEKQLKKELELSKIKAENKKMIGDIRQLPLGSKLELNIANKSILCNLAAKISSTGKYIFTDSKGTKIKEMLEDELIEQYNLGLIRIKHKNDLFDDALASVISNMRGSKLDSL